VIRVFAEDSLTMDTVYSGRVFQVEVHQVRLHDGSSARREIVRHSGGACVVALDEQNRVSMVRQYRKAFERELLELPAGKLEPGEAPPGLRAARAIRGDRFLGRPHRIDQHHLSIARLLQ
jgi:hypothetical protein